MGSPAPRFSPTPSFDPGGRPVASWAVATPGDATAVGVLVDADRSLPQGLATTRQALAAAGFNGAVGQTLVLPGVDALVRIAVGIGDSSTAADSSYRAAGAAFARAAAGHGRLAIEVPSAAAAGPVVEGALLARYRYDVLRTSSTATPLHRLTVITGDGSDAADEVRRAAAFAGATMLARDLANTPHSHLSATRMAQVATAVGAARDLGVEVIERDDLVAMGIGGLLGVNAGSAEPPTMIKLTYTPRSAGTAPARLALVGKGIMYDAGGLAIKPGDAVHAQMKNDMSGAAAILAAMSVLAELGCPTAVTGYLMCTDNMPGSTAMALGDVITIRGGTTVEVVNTDAEGRLVMADGLVLAREAQVDAIVDIATLTGAMMRALGREVAGVIGNDQPLVDQVLAAGGATGEPVWQLPLHHGYRGQLSSSVADMKNMGYGDGGAITAALFLAEFVGDVPWAHIDIAGTAQSEGDKGWMTEGCTGFGARLLLQLALDFEGSPR
jgi:leucyl aminopeptidase